MCAIAVQGAIGEMGKKATTRLTNYAFNSMAIINGFPFAANASGVYRLNTGDRDTEGEYTRTVIFPETDFNNPNPKRIRFVDIGLRTAHAFTVKTTTDNGEYWEEEYEPVEEGYFTARVPMGRNVEGRYHKIQISSKNFMRIDSVIAVTNITSRGKSK